METVWKNLQNTKLYTIGWGSQRWFMDHSIKCGSFVSLGLF